MLGARLRIYTAILFVFVVLGGVLWSIYHSESHGVCWGIRWVSGLSAACIGAHIIYEWLRGRGHYVDPACYVFLTLSLIAYIAASASTGPH